MPRIRGSSRRGALPRGLGFLENDLSTAARGVAFKESKLIERVGRPAPRVQSPHIGCRGLERGRPGGSPSFSVSRHAQRDFCRVYATADRSTSVGRWIRASIPGLLDRNARNSAAHRPAGRTCRPTKVRFIRLWQRLGEILDAVRPQEGEYRPRSITTRGICGQDEHGNTQMLAGWTREWATRGQKGRGCVGSQPEGGRRKSSSAGDQESAKLEGRNASKIPHDAAIIG